MISDCLSSAGAKRLQYPVGSVGCGPKDAEG